MLNSTHFLLCPFISSPTYFPKANHILTRHSSLILTIVFFISCSQFSDVNISALLSSFQVGYDKRVRPNYGGKQHCQQREKERPLGSATGLMLLIVCAL